MPSPDAEKLGQAIPRLQEQTNIWLCTVRTDGRPHLIPIWFVWHNGKVWICTPKNSQKVINISKNPHVAVALEDGTHPVILEGTAALREETTIRDNLAPVFVSKYEWDFRTDDEADYHLIEITPSKILSW